MWDTERKNVYAERTIQNGVHSSPGTTRVE
jgi:hypothetical protein